MTKKSMTLDEVFKFRYTAGLSGEEMDEFFELHNSFGVLCKEKKERYDFLYNKGVSSVLRLIEELVDRKNAFKQSIKD